MKNFVIFRCSEVSPLQKHAGECSVCFSSSDSDSDDNDLDDKDEDEAESSGTAVSVEFAVRIWREFFT